MIQSVSIRKLASGLTVAGFILLTACSDRDSPTEAVPAGAGLALAAVQEGAARELARAVALALNDQGMRQRVRNDMVRSPFREHKLDLTSYLHGESGGILLAKMAKETGRSRGDLLGLMASAPVLEFYMPMRAHRAAWKGGDNLLVAAQLDERNAPEGFDLRGQPVALSKDAPPATPTLVLVPVETDFSTIPARPAVQGGALLSLSSGSESPIGGGAPVDECRVDDPSCVPYDECSADPYAPGCPEDPCLADPYAFECDNTPYTEAYPAPPTLPAGIYMEQYKMTHDGEGWGRGAPEIEVHLFGTIHGQYQDIAHPDAPAPILVYNASALRTDVPLDCAGEERSGIRYFNFNKEDNEYNRTILFAQAGNFLVNEKVQSTRSFGGGGKLTLVERNVPAGGPFKIRIIERDDGSQCPAPMRTYRLEGKLEISWTPDGYKFNASGWGWDDLMALIGGNNDQLASWTVNTMDELEQMNDQYFGYAPHARIRASNRGFHRSQIPAGYTNLYWPLSN